MKQQLATSESEVSLIKNTDFEKLVLEYSQVQDSHRMSNLNMKRRKDIELEIKVAYSFLRDMGKPQVDMTIEEFEIAQMEIKKGAQHRAEKLNRKIKKFNYVLLLVIPLFCRFIEQEKLKVQEFIAQNGRPSNDYLDYCGRNDWSKRCTLEFVPNLDELAEEVFQKRFSSLAVQ